MSVMKRTIVVVGKLNKADCLIQKRREKYAY